MTNEVLIRMRRISVFGLSANPPTDLSGHGGIVQHLVQSGDCDEVWLLPVYVHIYSSKRRLERFEHRLRMCEMLAEKLSTDSVKVVAMDLERVVYQEELGSGSACTSSDNPHSEVRVGTIDVIRFIRRYFKDIELVSINLGADSYNDLVAGKWKCSREILCEVAINVYVREGFEEPSPSPTNALKVRVIRLNSLKFTSSSAVRISSPGVLVDWPFSIPSFIDRHKRTVPVLSEVYDYIRTEKIYFYSDTEVNRRLRWRCILIAFVVSMIALVRFDGGRRVDVIPWLMRRTIYLFSPPATYGR